MKSRKILLLCQYFYPEKISSGVLPYELARELSKTGNAVTAMVGYPKEYTDSKSIPLKETTNGINIRRVRYIQSDRSNFFGRILNYTALCISMLFHPIQFCKNDTYICYTNPPLLPFISVIFKRILRKKMFLVVYDLYPDIAIRLGVLKNNSIIAQVFEKANKFVFNNVDSIVVLSTEMKKYLISNKKIQEDKVLVIPNWYSELKVKKIGNKNDKLQVFYGGNMGMAQDMDTIMEAIKLLKVNDKVEFHFVGHGIKKQLLEKTISANSIKNCFVHGFLAKENYDNMILFADLLVVSLEKNAWGLGSPSKVYSYLAAGKAILAIMPESTDVVDDIKKYQNGFHIKNNDVNSLVNLITDLSENKKILEKMGDQSLKLFLEKYTLEKCTKQYLEII